VETTLSVILGFYLLHRTVVSSEARMPDYYKQGSYNAVCQVCGFYFKAEEIKKRWDGVLACEKDFEHRHPQDFIRARKDGKPLPFVSPEPADTFVTVNYVASTVGTQDNTIPSGDNDGSL
jgi:hypothetical protein